MENRHQNEKTFTPDYFKQLQVGELQDFLKKRVPCYPERADDLSRYELETMAYEVSVIPVWKWNRPLEYYRQLLLPCRGANNLVQPCPDMDLRDGWLAERDAMETWPKITTMDVDLYRFVKDDDETARRAFHNALTLYYQRQHNEIFKGLKEIFYHPISRESYYCYMKSEHENEDSGQPNHKVWALVDVEGTVHSSYCSCFTDYASSCRHVVALLYKLALITDESNPNLCKCEKCRWYVGQHGGFRATERRKVSLVKQSLEKRPKKTEKSFFRSYRPKRFSSVKRQPHKAYQQRRISTIDELFQHLRRQHPDIIMLEVVDPKYIGSSALGSMSELEHVESSEVSSIRAISDVENVESSDAADTLDDVRSRCLQSDVRVSENVCEFGVGTEQCDICNSLQARRGIDLGSLQARGRMDLDSLQARGGIDLDSLQTRGGIDLDSLQATYVGDGIEPSETAQPLDVERLQFEVDINNVQSEVEIGTM